MGTARAEAEGGRQHKQGVMLPVGLPVHCLGKLCLTELPEPELAKGHLEDTVLSLVFPQIGDAKPGLQKVISALPSIKTKVQLNFLPPPESTCCPNPTGFGTFPWSD